MGELTNYSIETDQIVLLWFKDGRNIRVPIAQLKRYLGPRDLEKISSAIKLRRSFLRRHMPKVIIGLVIGGCLGLLMGGGGRIVAQLLTRPAAPAADPNLPAVVRSLGEPTPAPSSMPPVSSPDSAAPVLAATATKPLKAPARFKPTTAHPAGRPTPSVTVSGSAALNLVTELVPQLAGDLTGAVHPAPGSAVPPVIGQQPDESSVTPSPSPAPSPPAGQVLGDTTGLDTPLTQ